MWPLSMTTHGGWDMWLKRTPKKRLYQLILDTKGTFSILKIPRKTRYFECSVLWHSEYSQRYYHDWKNLHSGSGRTKECHKCNTKKDLSKFSPI
jgi:hypothetical protein